MPDSDGTARILLVEDNPGDIRLTQEAFRDGHIRNEMDVVMDGEAAMAYLRGDEPYADRALPDLILLDLNLPRKDGREVLSEIKEDSTLRRIPVIVLTTSSAEQDILRSYDLHANSYVTKPVDLDEFLAAVRSIEEFWLALVKLPSRTTDPGHEGLPTGIESG